MVWSIVSRAQRLCALRDLPTTRLSALLDLRRCGSSEGTIGCGGFRLGHQQVKIENDRRMIDLFQYLV